MKLSIEAILAICAAIVGVMSFIVRQFILRLKPEWRKDIEKAFDLYKREKSDLSMLKQEMVHDKYEQIEDDIKELKLDVKNLIITVASLEAKMKK